MLEEMNNGQLQVFVNDLYCQIEGILKYYIKLNLVYTFVFYLSK